VPNYKNNNEFFFISRIIENILNLSSVIIETIMEWIDWLLCAGTVAAFGFAFQMLLPPYGWIAGFIVACLMLFRAKKKRDDLHK